MEKKTPPPPAQRVVKKGKRNKGKEERVIEGKSGKVRERKGQGGEGREIPRLKKRRGRAGGRGRNL